MGQKWLGGRKAMYARKAAAGICRDCPRKAVPGQLLCKQCKNRKDAARLRRHAKLKDAVFEAYGGYRCACCGETHREFLHIDHANGDGAEHRRQIGDPSGANLYAWLKKNNFPPGFRVLCANCNWSYGRCGYCPHQKETSIRKKHFISPTELDLVGTESLIPPLFGRKRR